MSKNNLLFVEERRNNILNILQRDKRATISELSEHFQTGEATIRRDLSAMEKKGLIQRTHGGAIVKNKANVELFMAERAEKNKLEKERIAQVVSTFIHDGEVIMIDSGSTTQKVAESLKSKSGLIVVTNSIAVSNELVGQNDNTVLLSGGELNPRTEALVGPVANHMIEKFRADRAILGMTSMDFGESFFTVDPNEAELKYKMMQMSSSVIVAMDSSKIGTKSLSHVCSCDEVDVLVTDSGIDKKTLTSLTKQGIEVIVV